METTVDAGGEVVTVQTEECIGCDKPILPGEEQFLCRVTEAEPSCSEKCRQYHEARCIAEGRLG